LSIGAKKKISIIFLLNILTYINIVTLEPQLRNPFFNYLFNKLVGNTINKIFEIINIV